MNHATGGRPPALAALALLNSALLLVCKWVSVVVVAGIAVIVGWSVIARYGFNSSIAWGEDAAKFLMVWLAFIGSPLGFRHGSHVAIELLPASLPAPVLRLIRILAQIIVVAVLGVLAYYSWRFAWNGRMQVALTIGDVSMFWVFVCMPIGAAAMTLMALEHLVAAVLGVAPPSADEAISTQGM